MNSAKIIKGGMAILIWSFIVLALTFTPVLAKSVKNTVKVPATLPWFNSRIQVAAGQEITIQAAGKASTLKTSKGSRSGPAGQKYICPDPPAAPPPCALNNARYGALVGKIGNNPPFLIGKKLTFTARYTGSLYLSVNDNLRHYADNSGSYKVVVTIR
jgi:hypothetical protein